MKNLYGVMQGRLLPKYKNRYQAHPKGYWKEEFVIAKNHSLDCIEFIFDYEDFAENPLLTDFGIQEIIKIIHQTNVKVVSVCADYFMEKPLFSPNENEASESVNILLKLLDNIRKLGVKDIVLPCVDQSSLDSQIKIEKLIKKLNSILKYFENSNVNLSLETDLPPEEFIKLVERLNSKNIKINYDLGNSAAMGYSVKKELSCYGEYISDVHIKDRKKNSGSVELGKGDVNFQEFFYFFKTFKFNGPFIMQAYRDDEGVEIFKKQYNYIKPFLNKFYE